MGINIVFGYISIKNMTSARQPHTQSKINENKVRQQLRLDMIS